MVFICHLLLFWGKSILAGLTIKVCLYDETERLQVHTEEKTLYTEEDFREFLSRRGWTGLREYGGFRTVDNLVELRQDVVYQGVRLLGG